MLWSQCRSLIAEIIIDLFAQADPSKDTARGSQYDKGNDTCSSSIGSCDGSVNSLEIVVAGTSIGVALRGTAGLLCDRRLGFLHKKRRNSCKDIHRLANTSLAVVCSACPLEATGSAVVTAIALGDGGLS